MISQKFRAAVKLHHEPQYRIAQQAGINPTTLTQIVTGYIRPKENDPRVLRVGELVGLKPEECWERKKSQRR